MLDQLDNGHPEDLITAAFSRDKKTIALGSRYFITLWDLVKRQKIGRKISAELAIVNSLAFSPDGRSLFSGDARMRIVEWDVQTQQPVEKQLQSDNEVLSVAVSPDEKLLATGTIWITLWDLEMSQQVGVAMRGHKSNMTQMEFSPDGKILVSGAADGTIMLWDVASWQPLGEPLRGHGDSDIIALASNMPADRKDSKE